MHVLVAMLLLSPVALAGKMRYVDGDATCFRITVEDAEQRAEKEKRAATQELRDVKPDTLGDVVTVTAFPWEGIGVNMSARERSVCSADNAPISRIVLLMGEARLEADKTVNTPLEFTNRTGGRIVLHSAQAFFAGQAFRDFTKGESFEVAVVRAGRDLVKGTIKPWVPTTCSLAGVVGNSIGGQVEVSWTPTWESAEPVGSGELTTTPLSILPIAEFVAIRNSPKKLLYRSSKDPYEVTATLHLPDCTATATVRISEPSAP